MTDDKNDGGPAFPCGRGEEWELYPDQGMSLRDYFAGQVVTGLIANPEGTPTTWSAAYHAEWAFKLADAMLKERDK